MHDENCCKTSALPLKAVRSHILDHVVSLVEPALKTLDSPFHSLSYRFVS